MRKRNYVIVASLVGGLMAGTAVSAWADALTPAIEEPVFQLGLLRGTPLGGSVPDGNTSSANPGRSYQPGYSDYAGGYDVPQRGAPRTDESPEDLYGYWRTGESTDPVGDGR